MARLTGCCCCFGLRDGAGAIGITSTVMAFIYLVCYLVYLLPLDNRLGIFFTSSCVSLVIFFNVRMVLAVNRNDPGPVYSWLLFSGVFYTGQSAAVIALPVLLYDPLNVWGAALLALGDVLLTGLFWYWYVVVLHCYWEMKQEAADSSREAAVRGWMTRLMKQRKGKEDGLYTIMSGPPCAPTGDASGIVKTQSEAALKGEQKLQLLLHSSSHELDPVLPA